MQTTQSEFIPNGFTIDIKSLDQFVFRRTDYSLERLRCCAEINTPTGTRFCGGPAVVVARCDGSHTVAFCECDAIELGIDPTDPGMMKRLPR